MTKEVSFNLLTNEKEEVEIIVDGKSMKKISKKNKVINTNEIYNMLKYKKENVYSFIANKKFDNVSGDENESKRLYNYTYDLLNEILIEVNKKNKEYNK